MKFHVVATSFFSTHHASAADVLAGRERTVTAPAYLLLAGRARRFTSLATQMHIEVLGTLPVEPTAAVFATVHGEIQTAEKLIADFPLVSGARFALSVHNSPSGVYSVATGSTAPTTTVTGANAVAAGWLEAALHDRPVLLSIADEPVPAVFEGPTQPVGVAAGFLLGPSGRHAELVMADADVRTPNVGTDTLQVLAQIADAFTRDDASVIILGSAQPSTTLELHVSAR